MRKRYGSPKPLVLRIHTKDGFTSLTGQLLYCMRNFTMESLRILDEIQKLMCELAGTDYEHRTLAEFLELLEDGEDWVNNMRKFLTA